jgi:hypothetical protein
MDDQKKPPSQTGNVIISGGSIHAHTIAGQIVNTQTAPAEIDRIFKPLLEAVRSAPPASQADAAQKVQHLKEEVAKGKSADDGVMAKLLDGIVSLAPQAVKAVMSAFGTPLLSGLAGPVTRFVLDKMSGQ